MKLYIYGASDDLVEVESDNKKIKEEWDSNDKNVLLTSKDGRMLVKVTYNEDGCWDVFPRIITDGEKFCWPVKYCDKTFFGYSNGYSPILEIECPDDVKAF